MTPDGQPMLVVTVAMRAEDEEYVRSLMRRIERMVLADQKMAVVGCELAFIPAIDHDA